MESQDWLRLAGAAPYSLQTTSSPCTETKCCRPTPPCSEIQISTQTTINSSIQELSNKNGNAVPAQESRDQSNPSYEIA